MLGRLLKKVKKRQLPDSGCAIGSRFVRQSQVATVRNKIWLATPRTLKRQSVSRTAANHAH